MISLSILVMQQKRISLVALKKLKIKWHDFV